MKRFFKILFGVLIGGGIAAVCLLLLAVNSTTQNGMIFGVLAGVLLAPSRVAGVDFRQWFRNPAVPLPINDDTAYGLVRTAVQATLGAAALAVAFGTLIASPLPWLPGACRPAHDWGVFQLRESWDALALLDRVGALAALKRWRLDGFFVDCHNALWLLKLFVGVALGVALAQAIVELAWRRGLAHLPRPRVPRHYLAPQSVPRLPTPEDRPVGWRRLIICCDGTWNYPEARRETNVIRLVRSITPFHNNVSQIVHYHQGVGTGNILDRIVGGGAGVGLANSVKACYGFLCDNYRPGDEIFLFGFSRGAFVARSIAGVVGTVGVLDKGEMERFFEVWDWYSQPREDRRDADLMVLAPRRHRNVDIECVGVWDTVGALGIPGSRFCAKAFAFYETGLGTHVRYGFQALAMDERRGNFQAAIWVPQHQRVPPAGQAARPPVAAQPAPQAAVPRTPAPQRPTHQVLEQVWMPGVHSNSGGGYEKHGLSDTAFLWMLAKLQEHQLLGLDQRCITRALDPTEPYAVGTLNDSRTIFWRLIGSPVPRPVAITSPTERVYDSAWRRARADNPYPVPANDTYLQEPRRKWLEAWNPPPPLSSRRVVRAPLEEQNAVSTPGPAPPPPRPMSANIGICGRLLQFVGGSG